MIPKTNNVRKISTTKDSSISRVKVELEKNDYTISKLISNQTEKTIVGDSVEFVTNQDKFQIAHKLDTKKIEEEFGVKIPEDFTNVIEEYSTIESENNSSSLTHDYIVLDNFDIRKNTVEEKIYNSFVSNSFLYPNNSTIECLFFVDLFNLFKNKSVFQQIAKNCKFEDFKQFVEMKEYKIYRERINTIQFSNNLYKFDNEVPDELLDSKLEKIYELDNFRIAYKFIDKDVLNNSFGKYRYKVYVQFSDPYYDLIQKILEDLSRLMSHYNNLGKVSKITTKDLKTFLKYEFIYYGDNSNIKIDNKNLNTFLNEEIVNLFSEKLVSLYLKYSELIKSSKFFNLQITTTKEFEEYIDVDNILENSISLKPIKVTSDMENWSDEVQNNKTKLLSIPKYELEYNVEINSQNSKFIESLLSINKGDIISIQYLEKFDYSVYGDSWKDISELYNNGLHKEYLCRFVSKNCLPINKKYWIIKNVPTSLNNLPIKSNLDKA